MKRPRYSRISWPRRRPQAVSAAKQLVFRITGHSAQTQAEQDRETARLIAALRVSDEGQEGMHAFLEKRKPDWIS